MGARFEKLKSSLRLIAIKCLKGNAFPWLQLPEDLPPPLRAGGRAPRNAPRAPACRRHAGASTARSYAIAGRSLSGGYRAAAYGRSGFFRRTRGVSPPLCASPKPSGGVGVSPPFARCAPCKAGDPPPPRHGLAHSPPASRRGPEPHARRACGFALMLKGRRFFNQEKERDR